MFGVKRPETTSFRRCTWVFVLVGGVEAGGSSHWAIPLLKMNKSLRAVLVCFQGRLWFRLFIRTKWRKDRGLLWFSEIWNILMSIVHVFPGQPIRGSDSQLCPKPPPKPSKVPLARLPRSPCLQPLVPPSSSSSLTDSSCASPRLTAPPLDFSCMETPGCTWRSAGNWNEMHPRQL